VVGEVVKRTTAPPPLQPTLNLRSSTLVTGARGEKQANNLALLFTSSLAVRLVVQGVVRDEGNHAKQFGSVPPRRWWGTVAPAAEEVAQVTRMVVRRRGALAAAILAMAVTALVWALRWLPPCWLLWRPWR
jgi:hypothetical protein